MLRIHQINCGDMSPFGGRLVDGFSHGVSAKLVCHCWIIETDNGLVLVDTGLGMDTNAIAPFFKRVLRPRQSMHRSALNHVLRLGFQSEDVKHIILTCMDFDHVGGLRDFPSAKVHVVAAEKQAAENPKGWLQRLRYRPQQWSDVRRWETYRPLEDGTPWFEFMGTQLLEISPEIWLIRLPGASPGHAGVAVQTKQGWMLHAGDAYYYRREVDPGSYHCTLGLRLYQRLLEVNHLERVQTQDKLRRLIQTRSSEVRVCSTHDFIELSAYQASAEPIRRLQKKAQAFLELT